MAASEDTAADAADDGFVSQEQYEQDTRETEVIQLSTGGKMEVQVCKPLEVVKAAQQYGVQSVLRQGDGIDRDEMMGDGEQTGIGPFMDAFVAPKITRPKAYWNDPDPSDPLTTDGFDLSVLDEDDIGTVVRGIMGQGGDTDGDPTEGGNGTTSGETE